MRKHHQFGLLILRVVMEKLDELWPLIERENVHKIKYTSSAGELKEYYANSREVIKSITEELPSEIWQCELITVENESELKKTPRR